MAAAAAAAATAMASTPSLLATRRPRAGAAALPVHIHEHLLWPPQRRQPQHCATRRRSCNRSNVRVHVFDRLGEWLSSTRQRQQRRREDEEGDRFFSAAAAAVDNDDDDGGGGDMRRLDADGAGALDGSGDAPVGPLAILAIGYSARELDALRAMLVNDLEADMVKLVPCTQAMLQPGRTLADALDATPRHEPPPLGTRRVVILSGMHPSEVGEVIEGYRDAGLPPCAWAGVVANNYARPLAELLAAIHQDQDAALQRQRELQRQQLAEGGGGNGGGAADSY